MGLVMFAMPHVVFGSGKDGCQVSNIVGLGSSFPIKLINQLVHSGKFGGHGFASLWLFAAQRAV